MAVVVRGLSELSRALALTDKHTRLGVRHEMRAVAEPVARDAESAALGNVQRMPRSPRWAKMRIGVTRTVVYVAPRERGVRSRGPDPRRRPGLANVLMDRAMEPALERHAPELEARVDRMLDTICDRFNHGGAV